MKCIDESFEVDNAIAFPACDAYMTGAVLPVDGGFLPDRSGVIRGLPSNAVFIEARLTSSSSAECLR
jgi:NAD(P)-dependent dehydrogenase (short-subunit alcohol dehydrogenase family)